ncbi:PTS transporter subunit EIIC [uncultured Agathobaculum sp.]|uniref:PTS transporter subunit EIIC n=1 Tax=uncultured Agathobaculum sp. TaxID=2048140 RepID=UPI00296F7917
MMKKLQKLGKALMLPVAALPICGILMGLGYAIAPGVMGVPGAATSGALYNIGFLLVKAGGALIDNMAWLFVIGVAVGLSDDREGTSALAGLVSWLMMTNLLSTGVVTTLMPAIADDPVKTLAFDKIQNVFIAIIAGIIGASCYNRFKNAKLPDWLAFFSGKRCVAIVTGLVSIVVSVVLLFVWPIIFSALVAVGEGIIGMDGIGAGIYAFLNRLLIPTGLHHALNNVFWFDTIGLGDLSHYWAGDTSANVSWSLGMYMSGFFPCMMFGIAGAALAMIKAAKNKKAAIGLVLSAAICAFICGVTEPFEFGFMFLCFPLYVVYAALYGIFTIITYYVGFRAGFCFSAGATDLVFSSFLPAANNTLMIIPLGIAAFVVFYLVFYFAITKFNLKTPGREDEEADFAEVDKNAKLANNDFTAIAAAVLEGLGGKENVESLDNCITRLRLEVKDGTLVNEKKIKAAGVAGVMRPSKTAVQVIIGTKVQFVADEMAKML